MDLEGYSAFGRTVFIALVVLFNNFGLFSGDDLISLSPDVVLFVIHTFILCSHGVAFITISTIVFVIPNIYAVM